MPYRLLAATVVGFLVLGNVTAVLPARRNRAHPPSRVLAAE